MASGLIAQMIEAPLELQKTLVVPEDHYQVCRDSNSAIAGNAAGNTEDVFDLSGQNATPGYLPAGFTARGIVALIFSILSAFIGMGFIAWYVDAVSTFVICGIADNYSTGTALRQFPLVKLPRRNDTLLPLAYLSPRRSRSDLGLASPWTITWT